jgi:hypothetical protein
MAIAIPMLLGYHPDESLVVSCLKGGAVGLTMRFDLAAVSSLDEFADELAGRISLSGADVTFVAVFTRERPVRGTVLPYTAEIEALYADPRLRVVEAVLVCARRWWSYVCADPRCCPQNGRQLDQRSDVATSLSAAFALAGADVLADRRALVAALDVDESLDRVAAGMRISAARKRLATAAEATRVDELRSLVDELVERFADPRGELDDDEIARLAALLLDIPARDALLVQAVPPQRREAILRILRLAVRRVPPLRDAPICTALAWFAYADGDGTTANIALDRALRSDPEYSLARLVEASLERQLPPAALVEVMKGATRDIDARDAAG